MSKASQVILLCEDKLHAVFVRRFLKARGYTNRDFRVAQYPASGRGSGESFVRRAYPDELRAYRQRSARATTFLIAVIDADTKAVADREAQFEQACEQASVPPRQGDELVVHAIPRRAINTWLAYLDGIDVDEATDYKTQGYGFRKCEADISALVKRLHDLCTEDALPEGAPPSLRHACEEFARIKGYLR